MDFSFSSDQQLLKNSARAFLDEHCKPATVRLLWDDPRGESESMWKEMAQLGWHGLSLPEAYGGSGLGMVETAILLEELGRAAYPGPYWPTVLSAAAIEAAGTDTQRKRWLSAIATGDARATLAFLDNDLDWDPAAVTTRAEKSSRGWTLSGTKRFVPWAHVANVLLIPARVPEGPSLFLVDPSAAGLKLSTVQGMDLATRWVHLELDKVPVAGDAVLVDGARPDVAALFPSQPFATRAGWGLLVLTSVLPNGGNGRFLPSGAANGLAKGCDFPLVRGGFACAPWPRVAPLPDRNLTLSSSPCRTQSRHLIGPARSDDQVLIGCFVR